RKGGQNPRPLVLVLMRPTALSHMTNSVEPSSPKHRLPVLTPVTMVPRCLPSGVKTSTPPGPVAHRLPFTSTFMPSGSCIAGSPSDVLAPFLATHFVASKNTLPLPSEPSFSIGKLIQIPFFGSLFATYSVFSSGDSPMPLGYVISFVSSVSFLSF